MPSANLYPSSACVCPGRSASKRQTLAWRSSSGHGCLPGDPAVRRCCWQAFDGAPTFTYMFPSSSKANGLSRCPRCIGNSDTISSGGPAGTSRPGVNA